VRTLRSRTRNSHTTLERGSGADPITPEVGRPRASVTLPFPLRPAILDERVKRIVLMVESGTTFAIRDLALAFHLSPSYLQRLFKHQTGVSMGEWLNEQKLQRAASLLSNSHMSVKEVAYSIGYGHASSFIRAFERRFTQAPARYRKQSDDAKC
jgi:AraC-like DNA-binding protein